MIYWRGRSAVQLNGVFDDWLWTCNELSPTPAPSVIPGRKSVHDWSSVIECTVGVRWTYLFSSSGDLKFLFRVLEEDPDDGGVSPNSEPEIIDQLWWKISKIILTRFDSRIGELHVGAGGGWREEWHWSSGETRRESTRDTVRIGTVGDVDSLVGDSPSRGNAYSCFIPCGHSSVSIDRSETQGVWRNYFDYLSSYRLRTYG